MRSVWTCAAAGVIAACAPAEAEQWIGFPGDGEAKTAIVVTRSPDLELNVIDLEAPKTTRIPLGDAPPYRNVHMLLYDAPPDRLGYTPGILEGGTSEADSIPLVAPDRGVFVTSIDEESRAVSWLQNASVPDDIASFRVRVSDECALFAPATVQEAVNGIVYFLVQLDSEHVLVRSTDDVFIVSRDARRDLTGTLLDRMWSAYHAPNGDLYLGDVGGAIWRAQTSVEEGIVDPVLIYQTDLTRIVTMDGHVDERGDLELFMVDRFASAGWWDGDEGYVNLGALESARPPLVWGEDGVAFIPMTGIDRVAQLSPSGLTTIHIGAGSQVMSLSRHERYGVVAGTAEGHFFALRAPTRAWGQLAGADYGWWGVSSAQYEDGFAFLLASGFIGTYKPARGFCEAMPFLRIIESGALMAAGRDLVVTAVPDDATTTTILYIPRL